MMDWQEMLSQLLADESDTMTASEITFINSLNKQCGRPGFEPPETQLTALGKVWMRVFLPSVS